MSIHLGDIVRTLRIQRCMTIDDLADKISVEPSSVSRLEIGKQKYITGRLIENLSQALNVDISELFPSNTPPLTSIRKDNRPARNSYRITALSDALGVRAIEYSMDRMLLMFGEVNHAYLRFTYASDDTMKGTIEVGDLVFIDTSVTRYDGDGIYAFKLNECMHIKRLRGEGEKLYAVADSPHYRSWQIPNEGNSQFHIFGKVLISQPAKAKDL